MATPIPCDMEGCDQLADILISDIANGGGYGWCGPHYLDVARAMVAAADDATATAEAAEADAEAVSRIEALGGAGDPTGSAPSSDADGAPGDEPGTPDAAGSDQDAPDAEPDASDEPGAPDAIQDEPVTTGARGRR